MILHVVAVEFDTSLRMLQLFRREETDGNMVLEVVSIDGDYANLRRTDIQTDDLKTHCRSAGPSKAKEEGDWSLCMCILSDIHTAHGKGAPNCH